MELNHAERIANNLISAFTATSMPACERIEIAGSVRRGKVEVKDIELVAVPILVPPAPQFGDRKIFKTRLDRALYGLWRSGLIETVKDGEKYKQFWLLKDRKHLIKIDLFLITPPAQWGVQMVLRTGPSEFSQWCVTQRAKGGALPDGYRVQDGAVWKGEEWTKFPDWSDRILMPEEKDFLDFLGIGWFEPAAREARW